MHVSASVYGVMFVLASHYGFCTYLFAIVTYLQFLELGFIIRQLSYINEILHYNNKCSIG